MVEVTQEDREAAASGYFAWCSGNPVIPDRMKAGQADDHSMVQAFARHRIAAENAALERAAKVADDYVTYHDKHDDGLSGFDKMSLGASEVAEEIRAMKGPSNAD